MYSAFFGLAEKPFAITPDPRYLFLSARHADALAHLLYGINEAGGFIQLTGEVGTGKTTTIRSLLARAPQDAEIALILNPRQSATEFLATLCQELGIGASDTTYESCAGLVDLLNTYLLRAHASGRRVVLIVDEAQNLAPEVLEQIRLLTNLETESQKLLQIILIGQPELRTLLARQDLRQLAQRITGRYHLDPLSSSETVGYVRHRLKVAGATSDIFTDGALRELHAVSKGIPRVINIVADRALLGAYTRDQHQVRPNMVRRAAGEVFGRDVLPSWLPMAVAACAVLLVAMSALMLWHRHTLGTIKTAANPAASTATAVVDHAAAPGAAGLVSPAQSSATGAVTAISTMPLAEALRTHRAETDLDSAFAQLLALWHVRFAAGAGDGCVQASAQGLQCLTQRGALAQLRLFNRPAILMLSDAAGITYAVVLRSLDNGNAQLQIGSTTFNATIADLAGYWFGDYVLLWNGGRVEPHNLTVGMHDAAVPILREKLARWRGTGQHSAAVNSDLYDDLLARQVSQFQRTNLLTVDGVAGIETQVALDSALAAPRSPVLQQHPPATAAASDARGK